MEHHLKTWPIYFQQVLFGTKNFELRKNDRNYKPGDILVLEEYDPVIRSYTGRSIRKQADYILCGQLGLPDDMCIISLREAPANECQLEKPPFRQCCCVCKSQVEAYNPDLRKIGYACTLFLDGPEPGLTPRIVLIPDQHSCGCECFDDNRKKGSGA